MPRLTEFQAEDIASRRKAQAAGEIHYVSNSICIHGHRGLRFVSTRSCQTCLMGRAEQRREKAASVRRALKKDPLGRPVLTSALGMHPELVWSPTAASFTATARCTPGLINQSKVSQ